MSGGDGLRAGLRGSMGQCRKPPPPPHQHTHTHTHSLTLPRTTQHTPRRRQHAPHVVVSWRPDFHLYTGYMLKAADPVAVPATPGGAKMSLAPPAGGVTRGMADLIDGWQVRGREEWHLSSEGLRSREWGVRSDTCQQAARVAQASERNGTYTLLWRRPRSFRIGHQPRRPTCSRPRKASSDPSTRSG